MRRGECGDRSMRTAACSRVEKADAFASQPRAAKSQRSRSSSPPAACPLRSSARRRSATTLRSQFGLRHHAAAPRARATHLFKTPMSRSTNSAASRCPSSRAAATHSSRRRCSSRIADSAVPAILQISSYWREGGTVEIDLLPDARATEARAARARDRTRPALRARRVDATPFRRGVVRAARARRNRSSTTSSASSTTRCALLRAWPFMRRRHRGLPEGRGHPRRRGHRGTFLEDDGIAPRARPVFHRRSRGHHRLARRLQFPVGLVERPRRRRGGVAPFQQECSRARKLAADRVGRVSNPTCRVSYPAQQTSLMPRTTQGEQPVCSTDYGPSCELRTPLHARMGWVGYPPYRRDDRRLTEPPA